jgi:hypothetical protein
MKSKRKLAPSHSPVNAIRVPTHDEIAARAKIIWEEKGCIEGHDAEIWLEAECQLYDAAEKRNKVFVAPKTIFDENHKSTHVVEMWLEEIGQPTGDRSPTSL